MPDRIDHAAEAQKVLAMPTSVWCSPSDVLAGAQVHATLALAEQHRIANLIALMDSSRASTNDARAALNALSVGEPVIDRHLRPEIARALGIGVADGR